VTRAPAREIGFFPLRPTADATDDPLFSSIEEGDRLFQWHEDAFRTPAGGRLLLTGEDGSHQAFRVGEGAWGTQFHPEVTPELLEAWLAATPSHVLREGWGRSADDLAAQAQAHLPAQQERARDLFRRFATLVTESAPARR
jgi:GMP synthase (glutamine-hydrolysing)